MSVVYTVTPLTEPEFEIVTLAEMKRHARLFEDVLDEDEDVEGLIVVAREWVEGFTGRTLVDTTYRQDAVCYPAGVPGAVPEFRFRRSPVLEVLSVFSVDGATETELTGYSTHGLDSKWPTLALASGTSFTDKSYVKYRAGFVNRLGSPQQEADVVPKLFKQAIKLLVTFFYENRDLVSAELPEDQVPQAVRWLLASQRAELPVS